MLSIDSMLYGLENKTQALEQITTLQLLGARQDASEHVKQH